jgi:hypothetical protein
MTHARAQLTFVLDLLKTTGQPLPIINFTSINHHGIWPEEAITKCHFTRKPGYIVKHHSCAIVQATIVPAVGYISEF